ncbi:MAG TPA: nickel-responsive transcriptional regulator NikR [Nitrososphaeraceae archaeon]
MPKHQSTNPYFKRKKKTPVTRISMSLPSDLLTKFDESMVKAGYTDRSKALQTAIHSLIDEYSWKTNEKAEGAGTLVMLYNNHVFNQDKKSTQIQHKYADVISASMHLHLENDNCLETILVKGNINKIRDLAKHLSENRGIKSLKVNFMSLV